MDAALYQKLLDDVQTDIAELCKALEDLRAAEWLLERRIGGASHKASYRNVLDDLASEIERQSHFLEELQRIERFVSRQLGKRAIRGEPAFAPLPPTVAPKAVPANPPVEAAAPKPASAKPPVPAKKPEAKPISKDEDTKDEPPPRGKGLQEMPAASSGMTIEFGPDGFPISNLGGAKEKTEHRASKAAIPDAAGMDGATINFGPDGFPLDFPRPKSKPVIPPNLPTTNQRGAFDEQSQTSKEPVDCTIFTPTTVPSTGAFLVQVFVHLPVDAGAALAMAQEFDEDAMRRGTTSLGTLLGIGAQLTFELTMRGLDVGEPIQTLVWRGRPSSVEFEVSAKNAPLGKVIGKVTVFQDSLPIGTIRFQITVKDVARNTREKHPCGEARRFHQAFISYASENRAEVIRRVQMLSAVGIRFFQDVLHLEPGERWAETLFLQIDQSDVLFLFWSQAARASQWVEREWRYGLAKKGEEFIFPIIVEGPPVAEPPRELAHLHFNDRLLPFLV